MPQKTSVNMMKPQGENATTININGHQVPAPMRKRPEQGQPYWTPEIDHPDLAGGYEWEGSEIDEACLIRGICHYTAEAAKAHAEALLSFSRASEQTVEGQESWPLGARVWKRESTQEWVLEIEGQLEGVSVTCRHTEPLETPLHCVPGLPSRYKGTAESESETVTINLDTVISPESMFSLDRGVHVTHVKEFPSVEFVHGKDPENREEAQEPFKEVKTIRDFFVVSLQLMQQVGGSLEVSGEEVRPMELDDLAQYASDPLTLKEDSLLKYEGWTTSVSAILAAASFQ